MLMKGGPVAATAQRLRQQSNRKAAVSFWRLRSQRRGAGVRARGLWASAVFVVMLTGGIGTWKPLSWFIDNLGRVISVIVVIGLLASAGCRHCCRELCRRDQLV
jgi:hypothetical protein